MNIKYDMMICGFCKQEIVVKDKKNKGINQMLENEISPIRGHKKTVFMCPHCYSILGVR